MAPAASAIARSPVEKLLPQTQQEVVAGLLRDLAHPCSRSVGSICAS